MKRNYPHVPANFLPKGTKFEDFLQPHNIVTHNGKPVAPFQSIPVRLLREYRDRRKKWKKGEILGCNICQDRRSGN